MLTKLDVHYTFCRLFVYTLYPCHVNHVTIFKKVKLKLLVWRSLCDKTWSSCISTWVPTKEILVIFQILFYLSVGSTRLRLHRQNSFEQTQGKQKVKIMSTRRHIDVILTEFVIFFINMTSNWHFDFPFSLGTRSRSNKVYSRCDVLPISSMIAICGRQLHQRNVFLRQSVTCSDTIFLRTRMTAGIVGPTVFFFLCTRGVVKQRTNKYRVPFKIARAATRITGDDRLPYARGSRANAEGVAD